MTIQEVKEYKDILYQCFSTDNDLLEKWHVVAGSGLDSCVEKTYQDLQHCNVKFYTIMDENELVGYFAEENFDNHQYLTGFFIIPSYRTNKDLIWNMITTHFNKPFRCGLYAKNQPAIHFIKQRGGKCILEVSVESHPGYIFEIGA